MMRSKAAPDSPNTADSCRLEEAWRLVSDASASMNVERNKNGPMAKTNISRRRSPPNAIPSIEPVRGMPIAAERPPGMDPCYYQTIAQHQQSPHGTIVNVSNDWFRVENTPSSFSRVRSLRNPIVKGKAARGLAKASSKKAKSLLQIVAQGHRPLGEHWRWWPPNRNRTAQSSFIP